MDRNRNYKLSEQAFKKICDISDNIEGTPDLEIIKIVNEVINLAYDASKSFKDKAITTLMVISNLLASHLATSLSHLESHDSYETEVIRIGICKDLLISLNATIRDVRATVN
jgi:hypothetical protein